jgi:acyl-CoA dehydrogenase
MIDFTVPPEILEFLDRLQAFIDTEVAPLEDQLTEDDFRGADSRVEVEVLPKLRGKAREAGVYAPQLPPEFGGLGLGTTALAFVSERCGPHPLASYAINMMAPDEATMHLLERFGTDEQKERWLEPLAAGEIRSCFGMTELDAGSDPRRISSTAERRDGGGWRINARKVFTSGAIGAAFCVVMAVSDPDAPPGRGISMFLVPTDAPGFEIVRDLHTMGAHGLGGHPEIALTDVHVGPEAQLGELGAGFEMAQSRLGTGRMGHAMRWIGIAQQAIDLAAQRALERETFGERLAERQAVQWWLADGATRLYAARLMVLNTLWKIERGLDHRTEVAMVKTYVAEVLGEIVDKALQVHGGWGYTTDFPFERWYRDARAARIYDGPSEVHRMLVARNLFKEVLAGGTANRSCGDTLAVARELSGKAGGTGG